MKFLDTVTMDAPKRTSEGYLVADVFAVRTGIQRYAGYEVDRPDLVFVDVFRPEEEVFHRDTLQSFSHTPVTVDHPSVMVDSSNWKDLAVGEASSDVLRDGERMKIPLILKDAGAISQVESGKRQLSAGYTCKLDFTSGKTPDGKTYDAVQREIRANHIAIVAKGRAGTEFRIGDADPGPWGAVPVSDKDVPMNLRTVVVDGISIQVTDQGAEALAKKDGVIANLTADNLTLTTSVQAKDADLAAKDAKIAEQAVEIATLKAVDHSALVEARVALVADAQKVVPGFDAKGLKDADIHRAIVVAKHGEEFVKDFSPEQIAVAFRLVAKDAKPIDQFRDAMPGNTRIDDSPAAKAHREYVERVSNGWKQGK